MTDKHWYIVQAYSNFERKVADSIREQAKQRHLDHLFDEVMVPTEKVVEVRRGQKVDAERKFFPGYVLVKMDLTDEAYHLIKNTPKVTGFLGADNKPKPISDAEAQRILHQVQEGIERPKPSISFEVGEQVRVSEGRSPRSTAWWRKSTTGARGSRSRSRSSAGRPGSSSKWGRWRSCRRDTAVRCSSGMTRRSVRSPGSLFDDDVGGDGGRQPPGSAPRTLNRPTGQRQE